MQVMIISEIVLYRNHITVMIVPESTFHYIKQMLVQRMLHCEYRLTETNILNTQSINSTARCFPTAINLSLSPSPTNADANPNSRSGGNYLPNSFLVPLYSSTSPQSTCSMRCNTPSSGLGPASSTSADNCLPWPHPLSRPNA